MKLNRRVASHALALVVLLALGAVVFHRSAVVRRGRFAPATAQSSRNVAAKERFFLAEGFAVVDTAADAKGVTLDRAASSSDDASAESGTTTRVLWLGTESNDLGPLRGILHDANDGANDRVASLTLHDRGGSDMRLFAWLKAGPTPGSFTGTYQILGGTGMFQRASGEGAYREAPISSKQPEIVSVTLEGTIRF